MAETPAAAAERSPSVVVFGATVAGLTAAHELARRGIGVSVIVAPGEIAGGSSSHGWTRRDRIAPFTSGGKPFPRAAPLPADGCADPLSAGARHLLDTLSNISSPAAGTKLTAGKALADALLEQPWHPLRRPGSPFAIHPRKVPRSAADVVDAMNAFAEAGYTPQDGHTFVARALRYLTSSSRRRESECETVSMLDYLRGANAAPVPPNCEYSQAFLADLADAPDPTTATRPSVTDARTGLGAYVQSLAAEPGATGTRRRRFDSSTRASWFEPWIRHLRDGLGVKFLTGRLARLAAPLAARSGSARRGAVTVQVVASARSTRRLIGQARYLIVATDAAEAEAVCTRLPPLGVPGDLRGFTEEHARWELNGGVQFFLPDHLALAGPLAVVGSAWRLVIRPQLAFHPRPPARARDRYGCVLSVDIGAWDRPAARIGKAAIECDVRQLAREVWAQIEDAEALRIHGRARPRRPSWFAADARVQLTTTGQVRSVGRRLLCLPGDWVNRPGPEPGPGRGAAARPPTLWADPHSGGLVHWNRLVFAGDYLKTATRAAGPEAACESGRRAANAVISHARARPPSAVPRFAPVFDPEAHELAALSDLKQLDDWCARERLPHPFALAGVDGWISLVSWFGVLYPVSEPFMKTVLERLLAMAQSTGQKTNTTAYQEAVLGALRNLREGLQRESRRTPG